MERFKYFFKIVKDNYANFNGRTSRNEFLVFIAVYTNISFVLCILTGIAIFILSSVLFNYISVDLSILLALIVYIPLLLFILVMIVPTYAILARRLHDVGRSGWHMFIPVAPIIWVLAKGDVGENRYGPAPEAFENPM